MAGMPKIPDRKLKIIKQMWADFSCRAIAERVGMSPGGVYKAGRNAGLPERGPWKGDKW